MTLKNLEKRLFLILLTLFMALAVFSCLPASDHYSTLRPAGFFSGIWHGWLAPISLILGLFNGNIRIYEVYNTGWWYDFGFYMAVISGFGGISLFRRSKND